MSALAREYIEQARLLSTNGCYNKALDMYLTAFETNSLLKPLFEEEFKGNFMKLTEVLSTANKVEELFSNFGRAIDMFPGNVFFLNEIGKYLYKFGFFEAAWCQFQEALQINAEFVNAERNLNSVKNLMVERWHFRMLNDKIRNSGYQAALYEMIEPHEATVLDLGTGTGLFAMYAAKSNPKAITACDGSDVMTSIADSVLEDNRLLMSVVVLNKMSTSLNYSDIGGKHSLLVTELFDAGLFGEHILQSLSHAWNNLLSEEANIIPYSAQFFILGVNSNLLNAKYQLCSKTKSLLNIMNVNVHISWGEETYDSDDVYLYNDIKYMTDAGKVVKIYFTDPHDIHDKLTQTEPCVVELNATKSGEINAFVGFFNLYLTTNITITTDPRIKYRARAWQQAVFFDDVPRNVVENETFTTNFFINSGRMTMESNCNANIMRISPESLRFLNDTDYLEIIRRCVGMIYVYLGQMTDIADISIVDLSPFPMLGLLMLKRGIRSLYCCAKTDYDKQFIEEVFRLNDIKMERVNLLIGDEWSREVFGKEKFHVIFCNIFKLCGEIDVNSKDLADYLKTTHLIQGGLFIPSSVTLMCQVVSSDWININNRVFDENTGYKISPHINKYQVSQNFCLDFTNLEYTPLSDPVVLGNCNNMSSAVINIPIKNDGDGNAIICWYNIELIESLEGISTKRPYSFIDGAAFLADPVIPVTKGSVADILLCVDSDGHFKLVLDCENT